MKEIQERQNVLMNNEIFNPHLSFVQTNCEQLEKMKTSTTDSKIVTARARDVSSITSSSATNTLSDS